MAPAAAAVVIRACARALTRWASRAYVAGPRLEDALHVCSRLNARRLSGSIGFWNKAGAPAESVAQAYLAGVETIARSGLDCSLSVKASAMGCSRALAEELLGRATQAGVGVHFDAMRPESAAATFELIRRLAARHSGIGCTLPARWQRSAHDAELALEHGLKVRVVKGQWGDPAGDPAQHPDQLRARYLSLVDRLAGRARHVGVATHDVALAREALRRLRAAGTSCQLELLFGLPLRASLRVAAEAGVSTRLYVPYGSAWIPYCLSRLRENPGVLLWLMRDAFFCRLGKIPLTR